MAALAIDEKTCVVRATNKQKGRTRWLAPEKAAVTNLNYGRIILDSGNAPLEFSTGTHETGLVCLNGRAAVEAAGKRSSWAASTRCTFRGTPRSASRRPDGGCDLAELSAPVTGQYPLQFVSFADVLRDPTLHFPTGGPNDQRGSTS